MINKRKIRFYILFFTALLIICSNYLYSKAETLPNIIQSIHTVQDTNENTDIPVKEIVRENNIIVIKIRTEYAKPSINERDEAFKLLKPYLTIKTRKASVIWQKDEFSWGKIASIPNVYINEYVKNKVSQKKFISYFIVRTIEPIPQRKNIVKQAELYTIDDSVIQKSANLREKADIYRLNDETESALRIYNQALEINPYDSIALFWIAEIWSNRKRFDIAEEYYIKSLSIDPDFKAADDALFRIKESRNKF